MMLVSSSTLQESAKSTVANKLADSGKCISLFGTILCGKSWGNSPTRRLFLHFLVWTADTVSILWNLGKDSTQVADGWFSLIVCSLALAPDCHWLTRPILCCAAINESITFPRGWILSHPSRPASTSKLFQLSIKPTLFLLHYLDIQQFGLLGWGQSLLLHSVSYLLSYSPLQYYSAVSD